MANNQRKEVKITLDKERTLRFTLNALAEIEDKLGIPLQKMGEVELGVKAIRVMVWAGLLHEDEEITERAVGNMIDFGNLEEVQKAVAEAFAQATAKN
jgi:hypothetical protein